VPAEITSQYGDDPDRGEDGGGAGCAGGRSGGGGEAEPQRLMQRILMASTPMRLAASPWRAWC